jgi:hypothetical protein
LLDLIGLVLEVIATIVVETVAWFAKMLFWPFQRPETLAVAARRDLPPGTEPRIIAALTAGDDAAGHLPNGWHRSAARWCRSAR